MHGFFQCMKAAKAEKYLTADVNKARIRMAGPSLQGACLIGGAMPALPLRGCASVLLDPYEHDVSFSPGRVLELGFVQGWAQCAHKHQHAAVPAGCRCGCMSHHWRLRPCTSLWTLLTLVCCSCAGATMTQLILRFSIADGTAATSLLTEQSICEGLQQIRLLNG